MLKEYISRLQEENERKIAEIEMEMQDLSSQLESSERLLAQIQQEKSLDKTIFSPRAMDAEADKKIEEKQQEIEQLKRRLDYTGQMRETEIKNRIEYQALADEAAQGDAAFEQKADIDQKEPDAHNAEEKFEDANNQASNAKDDDLLAFLNSSCKKIEYSLSLVNGNKNRCKSELRNLLQMTRSYIKKVENNA